VKPHHPKIGAARAAIWLLVASGEAETALAAFSRYGNGRGHPAQLNLGDCFAYAMAKNRRTALLFTGDDFSPHRLHRLRNRPNHPLRHRQVSNSPLPRPSQRLYNRFMPK